MVISVSNALHYTWGEHCDGWHLLQSASLSVIRERMPPGTREQLHRHQKAQQVFYIISGTATFHLDGKIFEVHADASIHVPPGIPHQIVNEQEEDLVFLVISEPPSHGDRENI